MFEIVDLNTNTVEVITPSANALFPSARGYHKVQVFGKILFLYGGKSGQQQILSDMWKLVIKTKTFYLMKEDSDNKEYLPRANYFFTKFKDSERPVIFGGLNRNGDSTNDMVKINLPICLSDSNSESDFTCLPCSQGYVLSTDNKCVPCQKGYYHDIYNSDYALSTCLQCPEKTYNDKIASSVAAKLKMDGYFANVLPHEKLDKIKEFQTKTNNYISSKFYFILACFIKKFLVARLNLNLL